jgi:transcriptional regulator with XRE-family HTH domain
MNEHKINIRHKVKLFRESKGFSQDYVANKIQLSQNALSKIERGEIKISFEKACVLAEALETDFDTLVNLE